MSTDFCALCRELTDYLSLLDEPPHELVVRAQAALAEPAPPVAGEVGELVAWLRRQGAKWQVIDREAGLTRSLVADNFARAADLLEQRQPVPPAAGALGPSMEDVSPLIAWLTEQACQAADASQPTDAGMLTWAAQFIGERVNEDAPVPPAAGEVGVLLRELRDAAFDLNGSDPAKSMLTRAADLLSIAYATGPEVWEPIPPLPAQRRPAPVPVGERLPGLEDCAPWPGEPNAGRWCWMASCVDNGWAWEQRTLGFLASFPQDFTHWLPAHALPLPQGEVE